MKMDDNGQSRFLGQQLVVKYDLFTKYAWFIFKQMVNMGFYFTVNNIYQPYDPGDQLHCREKTEVPGENHIPTMEYILI